MVRKKIGIKEFNEFVNRLIRDRVILEIDRKKAYSIAFSYYHYNVLGQKEG